MRPPRWRRHPRCWKPRLTASAFVRVAERCGRGPDRSGARARYALVADGHHRSEAATRVAGDADGASFLVVGFPESEMRILDYNRAVRDLGDRSTDEFLAALQDAFAVAPSDRPVRPDRPGRFGLYLAGRWYRLAVREMPAEEAIRRLRRSMPRSFPTCWRPCSDRGLRRPEIDFVAEVLDGSRSGDSGERRGFALHPVRSPALRRRRCRWGHAAQIDLVRAQAGGRAALPAAGRLRWRSRTGHTIRSRAAAIRAGITIRPPSAGPITAIAGVTRRSRWKSKPTGCRAGSGGGGLRRPAGNTGRPNRAPDVSHET